MVPLPFSRDKIVVLYKCGNLAFVGIDMYAGPLAELVYKIENRDHILHRAGDAGQLKAA